MKQNMYDWIGNLINAPRKKPMPILSFPAIQLMDINVREFIASSDLQARGMKRIADRAPAAAAVSLMDLSVEAECFGAKISVTDDEVPTVVGRVVRCLADAENLRVPRVGAGRTGVYADAVRKAAALIQDRPVFSGVIGPFSLAGRLLDVTEAMMYCYDEPAVVERVLKKATEFIIAYIRQFKRAGANGVVIAEPLAGLLSPALARQFSGDYCKRIVDAVQDEAFVVIYHNCGNSTIQTVDSILQNGAKAFHFGNAIHLPEMMKHIPDDVVVMGNIDPASQFRHGTPQSIRTATLELLRACGKYKNFVISSGCDIPPLSPWENTDAFFAAAEEYYSA